MKQRLIAVFIVVIAILALPQFCSAMDDAKTARLLAKLRASQEMGHHPIAPTRTAPEFALLDPIQPLKLDGSKSKTGSKKVQGTELEWLDTYDWFNDGYVVGLVSRDFDLIVAPEAYDLGNTVVRANFLQLGPRFRMHLDYLTDGLPGNAGKWDFGPSFRVFKSGNGDWAVDAEPSMVDGRLGFVVKTPWGVAAKFRFDSVSNRQFIRDGLGRGLVTGLALAGTTPPKGPMAQVAEHVLARTLVRIALGGGNPLGHILIEGLLKRLFRAGGIFGDFFDAPNTPGLSVAKQTLSDNGGVTPLKHESKKRKSK